MKLLNKALIVGALTGILTAAPAVAGLNPHKYVNGYKMTSSIERKLRLIAAIYEGNIQIEKIGDKYVAFGNPTIKDDKILHKVIEQADGLKENKKDKEITAKEASDLLEETFKKYAK